MYKGGWQGRPSFRRASAEARTVLVGGYGLSLY